jgi:hypothetical protein
VISVGVVIDVLNPPNPLRYPLWHQAATSSDRLGPADLSLMRRHVG